MERVNSFFHQHSSDSLTSIYPTIDQNQLQISTYPSQPESTQTPSLSFEQSVSGGHQTPLQHTFIPSSEAPTPYNPNSL